MPMSPLVQSMLYGGNANGQANPAAMPFMPQMSLAQSMMQGNDGSPAYPMQALSRASSSILGALMLKHAMGGMSEAYGNAAQAAAQTLPAGHPLVKALTSPNPMVQYQALQAFDKIQTELGDVQKVGPNETLNYGNGTTAFTSKLPSTEIGKLDVDRQNATTPLGQQAATSAEIHAGAPGGIVATPQGAVAMPGFGAAEGQIEGDKITGQIPGKVAEATAMIAPQAQAAGAQAAAKAPYESGDSVVINGQTYPITADMRAKLGDMLPGFGNGSVGGGASGAPSANFGEGDAQKAAQNLGFQITSGQRTPGHNAAIGGAPNSDHISGNAADVAIPHGKAGAEYAAEFNAQLAAHGLPGHAVYESAASPHSTGPHLHWDWAGGGQSAPHIQGKPLPNQAIQPLVDNDAKEVATDRAAADKGQQDMALVRQIQDLMSRGIKTGFSAPERLEASRVLKSMGVPDAQVQSWMNINPADGQLLQKNFLQLSAAAARQMGAREPGSVIQMFAKAYPNLGTDPNAIKMQTNALYMDRMRQNDLATAKTNYLNESANGVQTTGQYRGLKGFNEVFNKTRPAENYLRAAEAMSGRGEVWKQVHDPAARKAILDLVPSGSTVMLPDGSLRIKP